MEKKNFWKLCFVLIRGILPTVLVAYDVLLTGMRWKRYFGCSFLKTLRDKVLCTNNNNEVGGTLGLTLGRFFSLDVPWMTGVIAKQALYWMDSIFAFLSFRKSPIVLFFLLNTFFRCSSNVNVMSKMCLRVNLRNIVIVEK